MLWPLILLSTATLELDPAWKPAADPLAPAREGKIQCHDPDSAARTCSIMTWYIVRPDGSAQSRSVTAINDQLAAEARMEIKRVGGGMCGVVDETYMRSFHIVQSRAPHAAVNNKNLTLLYREALVEALWNRTHCAFNYTRDADDVRLDVSTVDGQFAGELMAEFIWISPGAGYRLKARSAV